MPALKKPHRYKTFINPAHILAFIILKLYTFRINLGFQAVKLEQDKKMYKLSSPIIT